MQRELGVVLGRYRGDIWEISGRYRGDIRELGVVLGAEQVRVRGRVRLKP